MPAMVGPCPCPETVDPLLDVTDWLTASLGRRG